MKKRIALISYHTCPLSAQEGKETGGMNVYVLELAKELAKQGFIIDIFTRDQGGITRKVVIVSDNLRVIHLGAGPSAALPKKELINYINEFVQSFLSFTHKENVIYDIFDCHYYLSGIIGLKIQQESASKIPLIITFHTLALMKNLVAKTENEKESQERVSSEMELVKKADYVVSTGETDAQYLQYLYECPEKKIAIVTPGVDTNMFYQIEENLAKKYINAKKDEKIILFVGRIEPLKGIDVLMYAIKILDEQHLPCSIALWIVGGDTSQEKELWPEELKKLEALRAQLGIVEEVQFVGRKKPEELPYYYNSAKVVVMPSQYESFGMSALEAMACGTPVITTDVTGVSAFLEKDNEELITSANNPLMLASQIGNLLAHSEERKRIGDEVMAKVQKMTWENAAQKMQKIYDRL